MRVPRRRHYTAGPLPVQPGTVTATTAAAPIPAPATAPSTPAGPAHGRGVALALLGALFWSLSGLMVRLTEAAGPWQIVLYRSVAMTATLLLLLAVRHRGRVATPLRDAGWDAFLAGLALTGSSSFFILSLSHVTVANALFMSGIAPFITALIARASIGEPVARLTWGAMALAAAGVAVMVGESAALGGRVVGNLLALGSAVSFALVAFFLRRGGRGADMTPSVLWSGVLSGLLAAAALGLAGGGAEAFALGPRDAALCLGMGAVQLGLGSVCYALAARHLRAAVLQVLALSELVMSPLWVWLAVGEQPAAATLAGGAMILAATAAQAAAAGRTPAGDARELRQTA
jgi:drug/metabolite transporter, DME family